MNISTSIAKFCSVSLLFLSLSSGSYAQHATGSVTLADRGPSAPLTTASADVAERVVTGQVVDANTGETLIGATIRVKDNDATGTVTDIDGNFSITVPDDATTLVVTSIGYAEQEVEIGDGQNLVIEMATDVESLSEVVVVGYGTQRKSDVTGAIGVVSAEELLKAPVTNALQGLQGKVAGVNIFLNSGAPTGSPRVLIRGLGTINSSSSPLYVVDGVVMEDIQFLNPNDIKSMEVLKDASATAIYGARGANGVILVTTKRGPNTDGITVGYDGYVSAGMLRKKMDVLNAEEWLEVVRRGMENAPKYGGTDPGFTTDNPLFFDENGNPLYDTDWQDEVTRTAISHSHQLSIQQRTANSSYGVFLNYTGTEGIMLNNYLNRIYGKVAYEGTPKDWLTFGFNILTNVTKENSFEEGGGGQSPRRTMIEMPAIFPIRFPDGTYSKSTDLGGNFNLEAMANPVHVLETQDRLAKRTQLFGNAYLVFNIMEGLNFRTQFGFDNHERLFQFYSPRDLINISDPLGYASQSNQQVSYWQQENYLNYNKLFGQHSISGVAGFSFQKRTDESYGIGVRGFADDFFRFNNLGAASQPEAPSSGYSDWTLNSYFLRGSYSYDDRYLLTLTGRVDGSSRFGAGNKYGWFPSVGVGWVVSNEGFLADNPTISQLKLRSSYGITGNTEIGAYQSLATVGSGTTLINGQRVTSTAINRLANPDLQWERTQQFDVGFNLALFNYRVSLEMDYYHKLTTDLLLARPLPQSTGFGSIFDNIGSVSNRGLEVLLSTQNVTTNNFSWSSTLNFNYNKNRIEKLGENNEDIESGPFWVSGSQTILRVGEPLSAFWGYRRLGTWGTDEADAAAEVGRIPGEAKRTTEKEIIGYGLPDVTGSFINNFTIGNFDFTADLQFVLGGDIMQQYYHSVEDRSGIASGLRTILTEAWTPENQNTMVQQIRHQAWAGQNSEVDDHWVVSGSYLRGNAFTLGYTLTGNALDRLNLGSARFYLTGQNLFVVTADDFQGLDPEATSWGGNQWGQGIFFFQYPRPRSFTFGLNVKF